MNASKISFLNCMIKDKYEVYKKIKKRKRDKKEREKFLKELFWRIYLPSSQGPSDSVSK